MAFFLLCLFTFARCFLAVRPVDFCPADDASTTVPLLAFKSLLLPLLCDLLTVLFLLVAGGFSLRRAVEVSRQPLYLLIRFLGAVWLCVAIGFAVRTQLCAGAATALLVLDLAAAAGLFLFVAKEDAWPE